MSKKFCNFPIKHQESSFTPKKFRNFQVKYQESSIGFESLAYLQSIENKSKVEQHMKTDSDSCRRTYSANLGKEWRNDVLNNTVAASSIF